MPVPETLIAVETNLATTRMAAHLRSLKRKGIFFNFQRSTSTSFGIIFYDLKSLSDLNLVCAKLGEIMLKPSEIKFAGVSLAFAPTPGRLKHSTPRLSRPVGVLDIPPALTQLLAKHGVVTIGELTTLTEAALRKKVKGLGTAKLVRIKNALSEVGLRLAPY